VTLRPEDLSVEVVALDRLLPHPDNPRQGDVGVLSLSLDAHGQYTPLVVQRSTGRILVGNHRWLAARDSGWTEIAVVYVDVDDEEAIRILLADNRTSDLASYDMTALAEVLSAIADLDPTLYGTAWEADELDRLVSDISDGLAEQWAGDFDGTTPIGAGEIDRVAFRFGDYYGIVSRSTYDRFVSAYEKTRAEGAELLEDVIDAWLADV
jgi:ParB-like nuclease domain